MRVAGLGAAGQHRIGFVEQQYDYVTARRSLLFHEDFRDQRT